MHGFKDVVFCFFLGGRGEEGGGGRGGEGGRSETIQGAWGMLYRKTTEIAKMCASKLLRYTTFLFRKSY